MKRCLIIGTALLLGIFFVKDLFSATFDLTGEWEYTTSNNSAVGGIGCYPGSDASGNCTIVQTGDTFTFAFTSGYVCNPPESCTFEGTADGAVYTCSTTNIVDNEGGSVISTIVFNATSATSALGTGEAEYTHPSGLWECRWGFNIILTQSDNPINPDIKANGLDGPIVVLPSTPVSIDISLDTGYKAGQNADWWLVELTPSDTLNYYNLPTGSMVPGLLPTYQGPLFNLDTIQILNSSNLAVGTHTFYFGVDLNMNGSLDMNSIYYDSVNVIVQ